MRTTAEYNLRERDSLTPITTIIPAGPVPAKAVCDLIPSARSL
jgi:hypothetical protein